MKKELSAFIAKPGGDVFLHHAFAGGESTTRQIFDAKEMITGTGVQYVRLVNEPFKLKLTFAGLHDSAGAELDVIIECEYVIKNVRYFLYGFALERLKVAVTVEVDELETVLSAQCRIPVVDEIAKNSYDYYTKEHGLSTSWWRQYLQPQLKFHGAVLNSIDAVEYSSAAVERAEALKAREKELALEARERQQLKEAELQLQAELQQYEAARTNLENSKQLNDLQRQFQLEELKRQKQLKELEYVGALEEHRLNICKMRAGAVADIIKSARPGNGGKPASIARAEKDLEELGRSLQASLLAAAKGDPAKLADNLTRIGSGATGIAAETLELLDDTAGLHYKARIFKDKADAEPRPITMRKSELHAHDIGSYKVAAMPVGSPLQFEFTANRAGYATILNFGTSGRIWLHSPNAYVSSEQAEVSSDATYQVPGCDLLPEAALSSNRLGYIEAGPAGWEELIVIISEQPLIDESVLDGVEPRNPFVELTGDAFDAIAEKLNNLQPDAWSVGILSFLVE